MKELNIYLINDLERLNNEELMENNAEEEIKRTNAISKASQTVINNVKLQMNIKTLAEKEGKSVKQMKYELEVYDEE